MTQADSIALGAAVVAVCALAATLWQAHIARVHNRLSVSPLLAPYIAQSTTSAGTEVVLSLRNHGIGPAIIGAHSFSLGGSPLANAGGAKNGQVRQLIEVMFAKRFEYRLLASQPVPAPGSALPQGGEFVIARLLFPNANSSMVQTMWQASGVPSISLAYTSLYREPFALIGRWEFEANGT